MPAAGNHTAEDGFFGGIRINMERLRIVAGSKLMDFGRVDGDAANFKTMARGEVFVSPGGVGHGGLFLG
jgi:hypothetical protein